MTERQTCFPPDRSDGSLPVTGVSFFEAEAFAKWSDKRIPKRKEWLLAALGEPRRRFPWGATWDRKRANLGGDSSRPLPVTALPESANPEGILQLYGNVEEWCTTEDGSSLYLLGGSFKLSVLDVESVLERTKSGKAKPEELFGLFEVVAPMASNRRVMAGVRLVRDLTWNRKTRRRSR